MGSQFSYPDGQIDQQSLPLQRKVRIVDFLAQANSDFGAFRLMKANFMDIIAYYI